MTMLVRANLVQVAHLRQVSDATVVPGQRR
jgi:hypothetical protein